MIVEKELEEKIKWIALGANAAQGDASAMSETTSYVPEPETTSYEHHPAKSCRHHEPLSAGSGIGCLTIVGGFDKQPPYSL